MLFSNYFMDKSSKEVGCTVGIGGSIDKGGIVQVRKFVKSVYGAKQAYYCFDNVNVQVLGTSATDTIQNL